MKFWLENPVYQHLIRSRLRGAKSLWTLLTFLSIICAIWMIVFALNHPNWKGNQPHYQMTELGQLTFFALMVTEGLLVLVLSPLSTASSVTAEREKQTLEMLQLTPLTPLQFMLGHLTGQTAFTLLMVLTTLPLMFLSVMMGGISPADIAQALLGLLLITSLFTSLGLFASVLTVQTTKANGNAIGLSMFLSFFMYWLIMIYQSTYNEILTFYVITPLIAVSGTGLFLTIAANKFYNREKPYLSYIQTLVTSVLFLIALQITLGPNVEGIILLIITIGGSFLLNILTLIDLGYYRPPWGEMSRLEQIFKPKSPPSDSFNYGLQWIQIAMLVTTIPAYLITLRENDITPPQVAIIFLIHLILFLWLKTIGELAGLIFKKLPRKTWHRQLYAATLGLVCAATLFILGFEIVLTAGPALSYLSQLNPANSLLLILIEEKTTPELWLPGVIFTLCFAGIIRVIKLRSEKIELKEGKERPSGL